MGCSCRKTNVMKTPSTPIEVTEASPEITIAEARSIGLNQCYECAKKHLSRAKEEFREYHTGYSNHIKNLIQSVHAAEEEVRKAFLKWAEVQAQLDMSAGELLGRDANFNKLCREHIQLANSIRTERLKLSSNPLYIPDFDNLLVQIQVLEYSTLE